MNPHDAPGRASHRDDRIRELIAHEAAKFILEESSGQSLITVTRAILSKHGDYAKVFVSIFPPEEQAPALSFLSRSAGDFRGHLAKTTKLHPLPKVEFILDEGETNRQRLDEISKKA